MRTPIDDDDDDNRVGLPVEPSGVPFEPTGASVEPAPTVGGDDDIRASLPVEPADLPVGPAPTVSGDDDFRAGLPVEPADSPVEPAPTAGGDDDIRAGIPVEPAPAEGDDNDDHADVLIKQAKTKIVKCRNAVRFRDEGKKKGLVCASPEFQANAFKYCRRRVLKMEALVWDICCAECKAVKERVCSSASSEIATDLLNNFLGCT